MDKKNRHFVEHFLSNATNAREYIYVITGNNHNPALRDKLKD